MNENEKKIARSANGQRPEAAAEQHSAGLEDPHRTLTGSGSAGDTVKVDLHCHSTASEVAKLGVQRALALPECATPPQEVYELAKRRGMDFVTITDHDTIAGVLELADLPDVFVSEELTAWFPGEHQAVHVLCFGITPDDHDWLQAHSGDVLACADYVQEREIACALAHPFFHVAEPLTPFHRRVLAELFPVWETRNGARARELNAPAAVYIETQGGIAVGGSDDHAGVDIGRTYTEAAHADTPAELLAHIRAGRVRPHGKQGSAAKWAHSALVLAARSFAGPPGPAPRWTRAVPIPARSSSSPSGSCSRAMPATAASARASDPRTGGASCARGSARWSSASTPRGSWPPCRPRTSATRTSSGAPGGSTNASSPAPSTSSWPPAALTASPPFSRACSRRACRRCRTYPRPPSSPVSRRSSWAATATRSASRSSPTAPARSTASPTRSSSCGSGASAATRSK